jgi:hypothetical protein
VIAHPGLPQIRTCGIIASGSSGNTFASPERYLPSLRERAIGVRCLQHVSLRQCCYLVRPFPRPGPRGREFPGFDGTMEHYDFLPPVSPHSVAFARRYLGAARGFALAARRTGRSASLRLVTRYPRPGKIRGDGRISYVPGQPSCLCPVLRPRWTRRIRPFRCAGVAPAMTKTKASTLDLSRLNHTASALAVYASQDGSPRHHARLASGRRPSVTG